MYNSDWYNNLTKPAFAPNDALFTPVWAFLYTTIVFALILYISEPDMNKKSGYVYFGIQLFLNLIWSPVFFGLKNIALALVVIIMLDIFVFLTIKKFYSVSKISAIILIPYFLWVIYATYLNAGYLALN